MSAARGTTSTPSRSCAYDARGAHLCDLPLIENRARGCGGSDLFRQVGGDPDPGGGGRPPFFGGWVVSIHRAVEIIVDGIVEVRALVDGAAHSATIRSRSVENTRGLHVAVTGNSGKGKNHACATLLDLIPGDCRLTETVSDKALYYDDGLRAGTASFFDDFSLSDDLQEVMKTATADFREPIEHRTMTSERKLQVCHIPEQCVWWLAKVENPGDDQVNEPDADGLDQRPGTRRRRSGRSRGWAGGRLRSGCSRRHPGSRTPGHGGSCRGTRRRERSTQGCLRSVRR